MMHVPVSTCQQYINFCYSHRFLPCMLLAELDRNYYTREILNTHVSCHKPT